MVSSTYCVVSLFCFSSSMFPVSLNCSFLIVPLVFSNVYLPYHYQMLLKINHNIWNGCITERLGSLLTILFLGEGRGELSTLIIFFFFSFLSCAFCFCFFLFSSCVLGTQCFQLVWIVHYLMPLRYSLTFIYIQVESKNLTEIISHICSSLRVLLTLIYNVFCWIKHIIFPNRVISMYKDHSMKLQCVLYGQLTFIYKLKQ